MDNYDIVLSELLEKLSRFNFAIIAGRTGADFDAASDNLVIEFFGEPYLIDKDSVRLKTGETANTKDAILIVDYLLSFGGLETGDDWIDFRDIPQSLPYDGAFRAHVESVLENNSSAILAHRDAILNRFSGYPVLGYDHCDLAAAFKVFPRLECLLLLCDGDEEIGPGAKVLFSSNAHNFMTTESLAALAETLTRRIVETA